MIPRPSFYTLEDLQEPPERGGWGMTHDQIMVLVEDKVITLSLKTVAGESRTGITAEERDRAEREARSVEREHPGKVKSALFLLAAGLIVWSAEDDDLMAHHYNMADFLANDCAAKGISMLRSRETIAELIREGFQVLRESGCYRPRHVRQVEAVKAEQAMEALQRPGEEEKAA